MRTLVSIATYNEIENLPPLVDAIFEHLPDADILVVDDNSPDGTGRWAFRRSIEDRRIHCLQREGKQGLGTAMVATIRFAIEHDYGFLINLDADFSHPPRYLPELLAGMTADPPADVMIASRYRGGGGVEGWPLIRKATSRLMNVYARALLGLRITDCTGSYRCYRVALLREMVAGGELKSRGYSYLEEILWRLKKLNARFDEVPIVFVDRQRGHSKINIREAFDAVRIVSRFGLRNWLRF